MKCLSVFKRLTSRAVNDAVADIPNTIKAALQMSAFEIQGDWRKNYSQKILNSEI